jgi:auxin influx carrier (AUX1 LAX family)
MSNQKQGEEAMVSTFNDTEHEEKEEVSKDESGFRLKSILWHGGSVYDAWFSCASNQVQLQNQLKSQFII